MQDTLIPKISTISDPYFRVFLDEDASSRSPGRSIWLAQHTCVAEGFAPLDKIPLNPELAIIKKELTKGHWSVLDFAYYKIHYGGFPHDTVMQIVRHQSNKHLVQSMRYTGKRLVKLAQKGEYSKKEVEKYFYYQKADSYATRDGKYEIHERYRENYFRLCWESVLEYEKQVSNGVPEESARRCLAVGFRQDGCIAGTFKGLFHMLDQRLLTDTQIEARTLAMMILEAVLPLAPDMIGWYCQKRAGKNLLSP